MSGVHLRLWCGFRDADTSWNRFVEHLAKTFVPATWQVMRNHGLLSYVPSVLPEQRPVGVPDELALLVYGTKEEYETHRKTVAGRSYSVMHGAVFSPPSAAHPSNSTIPTPWPGGDGGAGVRKAWHRSPSADGPRFLDPNVTLQFIALSLAAGPAPGAAICFDALTPSGAEAAVLLAPAFALAWIAVDSPAAGEAVTAAFAQAVQGSQLVASHSAVRSDVTKPGHEEYDGVSLTANQSLRFIV